MDKEAIIEALEAKFPAVDLYPPQFSQDFEKGYNHARQRIFDYLKTL